MKCVVISLLILGVCFGEKLRLEHSGDSILKKLFHPASYNDEPVLRKIRSSHFKDIGRKDEYSTVIIPYLPKFLDPIDVEDVTYNDKNHPIHFKNVKVSGLSTAHSVFYRIGLVSRKVDIELGLSKAQIKGTYSILPSGDNKDFVYNLYGHIALIQNISYAVEAGKVTFGNGVPYFVFRKTEIEYSGAEDLKLVCPQLLNAAAGKLSAEVLPKLSVSLSEQVVKVSAFKARRDSAARIQKAISECFVVVENTHTLNEELGVYYHDNTSFSKTIGKLDVKIPYFTLRGVELFSLTSMQPSFSEKGVYIKAVYTIPEGAVMLDVHYRKANDDKFEYQVTQAEYLLSSIVYTINVSEKLDGPVELDNATIHVDHIKVAPTQGPFGNELDELIPLLPEHLYSYFNENLAVAVRKFVNGFFADHLNNEKRSGV